MERGEEVKREGKTESILGMQRAGGGGCYSLWRTKAGGLRRRTNWVSNVSDREGIPVGGVFTFSKKPLSFFVMLLSRHTHTSLYISKLWKDKSNSSAQFEQLCVFSLLTLLVLLSRTLQCGFICLHFFFFSVDISSGCFYMYKPQLNMFLQISIASLRIVP